MRIYSEYKILFGLSPTLGTFRGSFLANRRGRPSWETFHPATRKAKRRLYLQQASECVYRVVYYCLRFIIIVPDLGRYEIFMDQFKFLVN